MLPQKKPLAPKLMLTAYDRYFIKNILTLLILV